VFDSDSNTNFPLFSFFIVMVAFFINHLFSFLKFKEEIINSRPNIGELMVEPYVRIIPMHLMAYFMTIGPSLLVFMLLKSFADVISHKIEHRVKS